VQERYRPRQIRIETAQFINTPFMGSTVGLEQEPQKSRHNASIPIANSYVRVNGCLPLVLVCGLLTDNILSLVIMITDIE